MKKITLFIVLIFSLSLFSKDYSDKDYKSEVKKIVKFKTMELIKKGDIRYALCKMDDHSERYFAMTQDFSKAKGYSGITNVALVFNNDFKIEKALILESQDTRSFVRRVEKKGYMTLFSTDKKIKYITGATLTCKAIDISIKKSLEAMKEVLNKNTIKKI